MPGAEHEAQSTWSCPRPFTGGAAPTCSQRWPSASPRHPRPPLRAGGSRRTKQDWPGNYREFRLHLATRGPAHGWSLPASGQERDRSRTSLCTPCFSKMAAALGTLIAASRRPVLGSDMSPQAKCVEHSPTASCLSWTTCSRASGVGARSLAATHSDLRRPRPCRSGRRLPGSPRLRLSRGQAKPDCHRSSLGACVEHRVRQAGHRETPRDAATSGPINPRIPRRRCLPSPAVLGRNTATVALFACLPEGRRRRHSL